ncbi:MoxR family ATPase [Candidatus Hodgkinia cicadicola]
MFSAPSKFVPKSLQRFRFDEATTLCALAGLVYNKRVLIAGAYGTGKSSHIEQICSRLNWPCLRVNMDSWLTRLELIGKDVITIRNGSYFIKFKYGIIPWASKRGIALVLDDYDACKPETKFVFNKLLEANGELSVPENNKVVTPHASFRVFATCNGVRTSEHAGTFKANMAQLDRWNIIALTSYLAQEDELNLINKCAGNLLAGADVAIKMSKLASILRLLWTKGVLCTPLSIRGLLSWAELSFVFNSVSAAFRYAHLNRCSGTELKAVAKCFNQVFGTTC